MNQKGIVWIPIIIWSIVISGSVFIAQDAIKRGYIKINSPYIVKESPQPTNESTIIPTSYSSSTPKTSKGQVQGITQTNQKPTPKHDGTRTGTIIDYSSLCDGKIIKVYENELIPFTTRGGAKVLSTQGDIDCYYKKLKEADQQNAQPIIVNNSTSNTPKSNPYQDCLDKEGVISQKCLKDCYSVVQEESGICNWAYSGPNAAIVFDDNKWRECSDESTNKFVTCQNSCISVQTAANNNCPH